MTIGAFDAYIPAMTSLNGQFWSTVIGAGVGGSLTILMQVVNNRRVRKQDEAATKSRDSALAISTLLKMAKIAGHIADIKQHMADSIALAVAAKIEGEPPWQIVQPMVGKTADVEFSDAERIFIVSELRSQFLTVLEVADVHNNLLDLMRIYSEKRIEVGNLMSAHSAEGTMATTDLTQDQLAKLIPRFLDLQSLIGPIVARSKQDMAQAVEAFDLIKGVCGRRFGESFPDLILDPVGARPTER